MCVGPISQVDETCACQPTRFRCIYRVMSSRVAETKPDLEHIRRIMAKMPDEHVTALYQLHVRLKTGCKERYSPAKALTCKRNAEIATAARTGDTALAERLRWQYYPDKMKKLYAQGKCPPKPDDLP